MGARRLLDAGDRIGRYEILAELGRGGMASVYAARSRGVGGFVAIKVLLPHLEQESAAVRMMLDEARIAAAIHHPNVVDVIDVGEEDEAPFVVMEYLEGVALHELLRAAAAADVTPDRGLIYEILAGVARGLHSAHETRDEEGSSMGVVHRDISPQNVHIGYDGHVTVVDFGIAAAEGRLTETRSDEIKGKLQYMAPEQIRKHDAVDRRADIWALSVMAWEIFAGRRLFREDEQSTTLWNVLHKEVPPLLEVAPDISPAVAAVVDRGLRRERDDRPRDCAELAEIFEAAARGAGVSGPRELARLMERLFPDAAERDRRKLSELAASIEREAEERAAVRESPPIPSRRSAAASGVLAAAGLLAIAASAGVFAFGRDAVTHDGHANTSPAATPTPEPDEPTAAVPDPPVTGGSSPADVRAPPAPEVAPIRVNIDRRASEVRVDGATVTERPLELRLADGQTASVELVGRRSRQTFEIGPDDDGRTLTLPRRAAPRRRTGARPRPASTGNGLLSGEEVF